MRLLKPLLCFLLILLSSQLIISQAPKQDIKIVSAPIRKVDRKGEHLMQGVLKVHPLNPRYFTDQSGKVIYLTGSHTWLSVLDGAGPSGKQMPELSDASGNLKVQWISQSKEQSYPGKK